MFGGSCAQQFPLSPAWLSKLTAFSMCQSRRITPGRYKRTRRQSKAVGSTGVDSGQLLEVIKAFEPESRSRPPFVCVPSIQPPPPRAWPWRGLLWFRPPERAEEALFISAGERGRGQEREREREWSSPDLSDTGPSTQLQARSPCLTPNTWLGMQGKKKKRNR